MTKTGTARSAPATKTEPKAKNLRAALVEKKGWSKQQLSARTTQLASRLPMKTADAHAVIAHQAGIKIDRYLAHEDLGRVQRLITQLNAMGTPTPAPVSAAPARRAPRPRSTAAGAPRSRNLVFPGVGTLADPLLAETKLREAREMAAVYPVLYVLENSMREVVSRVMRVKYGKDWWDTALTGGKVKTLKQNSDQRREKEGKMSWHQRRGAHPIDYIDLGQLGEIIAAKQEDFFPDVLGEDKAWFDQFMRELVPSRNVLCHMNPLATHNTADILVKASRWNTLITERRDKIPEA